MVDVRAVESLRIATSIWSAKVAWKYRTFPLGLPLASSAWKLML